MKASKFFELLRHEGIWKSKNEANDLKKLFELSAKHPDLLMLRTIKKVMAQLQENEEFMEAIKA